MMGYIPETCQAKNASIKLPSCIKLAFNFISEELFCLFQSIRDYTRQVLQVVSPAGKKSKQRNYRWDIDLLLLR